MLKKYLSHSLVRYILVGGSAYAVELLILFSLHKLIGLSATTATAISFWVSIVTSFFLQKIFSFKNYQKQVKMLSGQFTAYGILVLFNYCFTVLVVAFFPDNLLLLSRTLALAVVTVWNYLFYRQLFSNKKVDIERQLELLIETIGAQIHSVVKKVLDVTERRWFMVVLTTASVLALLGTSIYVGLQATKVQIVTSDQYISTYNYSGEGTPSVDLSHTNILKAPILWIQGHLPYNMLSLVAVNIGFIFISFVLWIYLLYRLLGTKVIALASLAFSAVLINSTSFAINITMTTIRHIEYPLAFIFILGLSKLIRTKKHYLRLALLLSVLLGSLIVHDRFFLYTLAPTTVVTLAWYYSKEKISLKSIVTTAGVLGSAVTFSTLSVKLIEKLHLMTIVNGYTTRKIFLPYEKVTEAALLSVHQTLDLFGGFIFGAPVKLSSLGIIGGLSIFTLCCFSIFYFFKNSEQEFNNDTIFSYGFMFYLTLITYLAYIFVDLIDQNNQRYLTLIVYVGVSFLCWFVLQFKSKNILYLITCLVLVVTAIFGFRSARTVYADHYARYIKNSESTTRDISKQLVDEEIKTAGSTSGYQSIRFFSNNNVSVVFDVLEDCVSPVPWINNSSWLKNQYQPKTAFVFPSDIAPTSCDGAKLKKIFGEPNKILTAESGKGINKKSVTAYIYNYDIRSKLSSAPN